MRPKATPLPSFPLLAAIVSIAIAGVVGASLLGIAAVFGWVVLDGDTVPREIAIGIGLLAIGAVASGVLHQLISSVERGPEILLGQLAVLGLYLLVGSMFDGRYQHSAVGFGALAVAVAMAKLCGVGARITWTFRDPER